MTRTVFSLLLILSLLCGCAGPAAGGGNGDESLPPPPPESGADTSQDADDAPAPSAADPRAEAVASALAGMSLEEKVGQMFFVRCPGQGAAEDVGAYHLGGYILFGPDFKDGAGEWLTREQFTAAVAGYQAAADIPLLIGVDEEGGTVARASRDPHLFPSKFRSPREVFAAGGLEEVRADTEAKSRGLLELGINVNLAPVADVSVDPGDFIYERALGQDGAATAAYVETVVSAANQVRWDAEDGSRRGIGSVLKHFPGYGDNVDTHTGVAIDQRSYERFESEDFLPFRAGIEAGAGGVLVSHNVVTCMDPELPASLSPEVHRVLREELGFDGVIMTDDLAMDAVEAYAEDGSVAVLAVLAGNDLIVTTDYRTQIPLVIQAVRDGRIGEAQIDAAVSRVLGWKYDLGLTFS